MQLSYFNFVVALGYPKIILGKGVKKGNNVRINVSECLKIGDRSIIGDNVLIEGKHIEIGREAWIDEYVHVGGGSCFDWQSYLKAGDFLHMGKYSHINAAREVVIGDECGIGIGTKIFSHGAYLSAYEGFPVEFEAVEIGNRVWLPHAWVNPGVKIGNDVVVSAMSLVNKSLPSGCLAGGIPVQILRKNIYPREISDAEKKKIVQSLSRDTQIEIGFNDDIVGVGSPKNRTLFDLKNRVIEGVSNEEAEKIKNHLRRYGIRFRYYSQNGVYKKW